MAEKKYKQIRRENLVVLIGCIIVMLLVFLVPMSYFSQLYKHQPLPMIADGLPRNYEEGNQEFKRRVQQKFPVGSISHQELLETLKNQGFEISNNPNTKEYQAEIMQPDLVCTTRWAIFWKLDRNEDISEINSVYGAICL